MASFCTEEGVTIFTGNKYLALFVDWPVTWRTRESKFGLMEDEECRKKSKGERHTHNKMKRANT